MPIDRPDPADAPGTPAPPDAPASPDAPRTPDALPSPPAPADRDAIHCAYRAQADRIYAAHRAETRDGTPANEAAPAWAEAVPSLRAAWADRQERYPERARATTVTHPDNSWSSGEARRLTPDQNAAVDRGCDRVREIGERDILPAMLAHRSCEPCPSVGGLRLPLKGADRLKEKVADRMRTTGRTPTRGSPKCRTWSGSRTNTAKHITPEEFQDDVETARGRGLRGLN